MSRITCPNYLWEGVILFAGYTPSGIMKIYDVDVSFSPEHKILKVHGLNIETKIEDIYLQIMQWFYSLKISVNGKIMVEIEK